VRGYKLAGKLESPMPPPPLTSLRCCARSAAAAAAAVADGVMSLL